MAISALADQAGVFEVMTNRIARWSRGSALRLYLCVFLVGTLITAVLSNDATALILTPVVYVMVLLYVLVDSAGVIILNMKTVSSLNFCKGFSCAKRL